MQNWFGKIKSPALQGLSRMAHSLFRAQGYRLELRRSGELKLGLWRKAWRKPEAGKTRRLVVIPGFGDTPLTWLPVLSLMRPAVRTRFDEIVFVDFPGFQGGLAHERSFHSMDLLMEKTFDTLDTLKPRALIGHSLGGWLGARYVGLCGKGERPQVLKKDYTGPEMAVFADPSGVFGDDSLKVAWRERFLNVIEDGFGELRPHVFAKEPFWFPWVISEFESFTQKEEIILFMESVRDDHLVEELLSHVKAKIYLLWGEKDTLTPPSFAPGWKRFLPEESRRGIALVKGAGHSPHIESPAATAAVLSQMFEQALPVRGVDVAKIPSLLPHQFTKRYWSWI